MPSLNVRHNFNTLMKQSDFQYFLLLFLFAISGLTSKSVAQVAEKQNNYLYPVEINSKWGFIDSAGKLIVQPKFKYANDFVNGLGLVYMESDTIGFINTDGVLIKEAINPNPNYKYPHTLSENLLAIFDSATKKFGFVNKVGNWIITPRFNIVNDFSNGLAAVWENNGGTVPVYSDTITEDEPCIKCGFGFIDSSGKYAIEPQFKKVSNFYNGFAYADGKIINKKGNKIDIRLVKDKEFLIHRFPFVDTFMYKSPNIWVPNNDENFVNGFIMFEDKTIAKYGFKDWNSDVIITPNFYAAQFFSEGMSAVKSQENKWGFINSKGEYIIEPKFDFALPFCEGLAPVTYNGKWGFIDTTGVFAVQPTFDEVNDFNVLSRFWGGLARMVYNNKMCYINRQGKIIWSAP